MELKSRGVGFLGVDTHLSASIYLYNKLVLEAESREYNGRDVGSKM